MTPRWPYMVCMAAAGLNLLLVLGAHGHTPPQPACFFSPTLRPSHTTVCDPARDEYRECTIVYLPSGQGLHVVGWWATHLDTDHFMFSVPTLDDTLQRDQCLCTLWERFPAYVIWQNGNPCRAGLV